MARRWLILFRAISSWSNGSLKKPGGKHGFVALEELLALFGVHVRVQTLAEVLDGLLDCLDVFLFLLQLGDGQLDLQVPHGQELLLVPAEVLPHVANEPGKRLVGQAEIVQRGILGNHEVGADDDLHQHRVVGVSERLSRELRQLVEPGPQRGPDIEILQVHGHIRIDEETGEDGQVQVSQLHGQPSADPDTIQDLRLQVCFPFCKEVDVLLHASTFPCG